MSGKQKKKGEQVDEMKLSDLPGKMLHSLMEKMPPIDGKRLAIQSIPYVIIFYLVDKVAWLYRHCVGDSLVAKVGILFLNFQMAFDHPIPSFHGYDLFVGMTGAVLVRALVYIKGKNAKKYRQGVEYGSARWSA